MLDFSSTSENVSREYLFNQIRNCLTFGWKLVFLPIVKKFHFVGILVFYILHISLLPSKKLCRKASSNFLQSWVNLNNASSKVKTEKKLIPAGFVNYRNQISWPQEGIINWNYVLNINVLEYGSTYKRRN